MTQPATQYTAAAKLLHWLMAALILCLLCVGTIMVFLPKGGLRGDVYDIHKQVGVAVFVLALLRLGGRLATTAPQLPASMPPAEQRLARIGHLALYLLMFAMPLSGIVMSQAGDHPVQFLGTTLPALVAKDHGLHELGEGTHELMAWALVILVAGHVLAAVRHHFVLGDNVLRRMLPGRAG